MCGIAGIVYARGAAPCDPVVLERMAQALAHRGPDGTVITRLGRADLVHTRLAIVDLAGGDQPLTSGSASLIANGEIYNDPEIRARLGCGCYTTGSDCESPLRLWERNGASFARGLRGMYAIALYDGTRGELSLSRDPFGIKPLYIAEFSGGVAFASEPEVLLASGLVPRGINPTLRDELLQLQFTTGRETIFPGISRLLPGETLRIAGGRVLDRERIPALPQGPVEEITEAAALTRLDAALMNSVEAHERADVPFGLFLSGGVDSASVLAAMAELRKQSGKSEKLLAWTACFDMRGGSEEGELAARMARSVGAEHEVLWVTEAEVWRHLPEIVACMDDPVADYAIIPTWLLAQQARKQVKVVLSGEGGDELFAGYGRYRRAMRPWWRGGRRMRRRGMFDGLDVLRVHPANWRDGIAIAEMSVGDAPSRLAAAQAVDVAEWLPNDLLLKLDRCLMAHGVEGRTPLLDPAVAEAAWRLPENLLLRGDKGKYLLRRWLAEKMPVAEPFAPKQGFTVPVGGWIAQRGARLGELVARQPGIMEVAVPERVLGLFRDAGSRKGRHAAWTLLFYALWHRSHVLGLEPCGDVFETLSAR